MAMQADTMSFFLLSRITKTFPQQPANIIPTSNMQELEIQMQLIYLFLLFPKQSIAVQNDKQISILDMPSELKLPNIRFRISVSALLQRISGMLIRNDIRRIADFISCLSYSVIYLIILCSSQLFIEKAHFIKYFSFIGSMKN